jgi:hypothetical protein
VLSRTFSIIGQKVKSPNSTRFGSINRMKRIDSFRVAARMRLEELCTADALR